jgi:UDPglucose 6-dehydrogenase
MRITVFGVGYVGLVQAACLAEVGHNVLCVDVDVEKINKLKDGDIPIYEPGLESILKENIQAGRLNFTNEGKAGVNHGEVQFIAVGTPSNGDGSADLKSVLSVAETIGRHMQGHKTVVNKSTVPVGTADKVKASIQEALAGRPNRQDLTFDVVSNPEFLKEGAAIADCMKPDRIVVGTDSKAAEETMRELYAPFSRNHEKIIMMDVRSAELTKYAANCMLATKISFMNEMANLAEIFGADVEMVRQGIGSDPRIGYQFVYPGLGYGGSCFPKDVRALIHAAEAEAFEPIILKSVESRNNQQKRVLFDKIKQHFGGDLQGKIFALWGLSFKPNTDDMREAASQVMMEALWQAGAKVNAYDPEAMRECQKIHGNRDDLNLVGTKEAALKNADALVVITEWKEFRAPDYELIKECLRAPVVFDGRNLYDPKQMKKRGITYYSVGRRAKDKDYLC